MVATAQISISDDAELRSLRTLLSAIPGIEVVQISGRAEPGQLGFLDILQIAAPSGGAIIVAVKTLPEFIKSRRKDVSVTVKVDRRGEREVVVTAANADDAVKLIEQALDAGRD
ncbi:hypothetical protein [Nocardia sp. NPDC050710]|uniref:effector-associated constant component EACC1 n=1 Tax=Nocardia sp. NPDC050710 TaxID=3157220 RepID=UPI00340E5613